MSRLKNLGPRERLLKQREGLPDLVDGDHQTIALAIDALCAMFELPRYAYPTLRSVVEVLQVKPLPREFLEEGSPELSRHEQRAPEGSDA
jgi:hypothetical protein